jgi:hypothetical protein
MRIVTKTLAAIGVLAGAAIGLANPASADPLAGTYTATVVDATDTSGFGAPPVAAGETWTWVLTPCGPDCTHLDVPDKNKHAMDLVMQGGSWTGGPNEIGCTKTINAEATTATEACKFWNINWALTKTG